MKTNKTRKSNKIMALLMALTLIVTVFVFTGNNSKASDEAEFGDGYYIAEESAELAGEAEVLESLIEEESVEEVVEEINETELIEEEMVIEEMLVTEEPVTEELPTEENVIESPVEEITEENNVEESIIESPVETPAEENASEKESENSVEEIENGMNDLVGNDENNQELEKELEETVETEEVVEETTEETTEEEVEEITEETTEEAVEENAEQSVEKEENVLKMVKPESVEETDEVEESVIMENMNGISVAPTFEMSDGGTAYCVEAEKTHPSNGIEYEASKNEAVQENYEELESIFVNKYIIEEEGETEQDLLDKATQQAIWSKTDNTTDYRTNTLVWLGEKAVGLFDRLLSWVDTSLFNIEFVEYTTQKTDAKGERYQTLLAAHVTKVVEEKPEEIIPEPEVIDPVVPDPIPEEIIPEPKPEEIIPEEPTPQPEPEKHPVGRPAPVPEVVESTPEVAEPVMLSYRPTAETGVLSWTGTVHTGDTTNVALYTGLLLVSGFAAAAMIIKSRKNK